MSRCSICKVPLSGVFSNIAEKIFKIRPSKNNPQICNKCADKEVKKVVVEKNKKVEHLSGKMYKCQICQRMIHIEHSLEHAKAEEYLINLIKKDHSHWSDDGPTHQDCVEYYRQLIKKTEI